MKWKPKVSQVQRSHTSVDYINNTELGNHYIRFVEFILVYSKLKRAIQLILESNNHTKFTFHKVKGFTSKP